MKYNYQRTIHACFVGYIVQAINNNFVPLLFLTFEKTYQIPISRITILIAFNFGVQLLVDFLSAGFVDKIGYRVSIIAAHVFSAAGLLALATLPDILPDAFSGLAIAVALYAIGGGLIEVLINPIMESCPTENKEKAMSRLHSFFCWGHVGVVLFSTLFFKLFGIENWRTLALVWMLIPVINSFVFLKAPIAPLIEEGERGMSIRELAQEKIFWILMVMMVCAGACEQAVAQWASTLAEKGLGVSKTVGDLAGPMAFAVLMGTARAFYGKFGDRIDLDKFMLGSGGLCVVAYLMISLVPSPVLSLLGCAVCGLSVGIMWPGTFSKASAGLKRGGTAMFALLALAGDVGCSGGPALVGSVAGMFSEDLKKGILAAVLFPVLLVASILMMKSGKTERNK